MPVRDATYAQTLPRAAYTKSVPVPRQAASANRVNIFSRPVVPPFHPSTFRQHSVPHAEIRGVGAIYQSSGVGLSQAEMAWADTANDWADAARMAMTMEDDSSESGVVQFTTKMAEKAREAAKVAGQIAKESATTKLEAASSAWTGAASAWVVAASFMSNAATEGWTPQAAKAIEKAARFTQEGWAESSKTRAQRAPEAAAAAPAVAEAWGQAAAGWEAAAQFLQFGDFEYVAQDTDKAEQEAAAKQGVIHTERVWASEAKWQDAASEWLASAKQAVASESAAWAASTVQMAKQSADLAKLTAQEVAEFEPASQGVVGKWSAASLAWQEASQSKEEVETARAIEVAAEATSEAWSATSRAKGAPTKAQEHGQTWAKTAAMWEGAADYLTSGDFGESMHPALAAKSSLDIRYFASALLGACVSGIAVAALRARRIGGLSKDAAAPFLYN